MVPVVDAVHAPTTVFTKEPFTGPPILAHVPSGNQLGSASGRGLEIPPTVGDFAVLTIVVANYW